MNLISINEITKNIQSVVEFYYLIDSLKPDETYGWYIDDHDNELEYMCACDIFKYYTAWGYTKRFCEKYLYHLGITKIGILDDNDKANIDDERTLAISFKTSLNHNNIKIIFDNYDIEYEIKGRSIYCMLGAWPLVITPRRIKTYYHNGIYAIDMFQELLNKSKVI